jgi:hypothetical protein
MAQDFTAWRHYLPQLDGLPLLPVGAGVKGKSPIDPATGKGLAGWQTKCFTPEQIAAMNGVVKSVGTLTGPQADHTAFIDIDGALCIERCKHHGCTTKELGWTIRRTTATDRLKVPFHIPEELRHYLQDDNGNPIGKVVLTIKPAVYDLDADGKPKRDENGRPVTLEPAQQIELFYGSGQCIVLGEHVESKGHYTWTGSPIQMGTPTTEWWALITEVLEAGAAEAKAARKSPRGSSTVTQSGPRHACRICGRNTSGACTEYSDGERVRINCFQGQTFSPPTGHGLKEGHTVTINGTTWAFCGLGFNPAIGGFATFAEHIQRTNPQPTKQTQNASANNKSARVDGDDTENHETPAQAIACLIDELLDLRLTTTDTWAQEMATISSLTRAYGVARQDIERRILEALAERWHLSITQTHSGRRTNRRSATDDDDREGQQMLVAGFLPWKRDALIFGPGGVGKTTAAVGIGWSVISGTPFLDHQIPSDITGKVLWIGSDGGDGAYDMWVNTAQDFGIADDPRWLDGCVFWGSEPDNDVGSWACTPAGLQELKHELENGSYALVVIDSWKAVLELAGIDFGIGPVGTVVRFLQALIGQHCSALYLHHPSGNSKGKGIAGTGGNQNVNQIPYAVHQLLPEPASDKQPRCVRWSVHKLRGYKAREFLYQLTDDGLQVVEGDVITNCADAILTTIADLERSGTATTSHHIKNMLRNISEKTVSNNLTRLRQRGYLKKSGRTWHLTRRGRFAYDRLLNVQ